MPESPIARAWVWRKIEKREKKENLGQGNSSKM